MTNDELSLLKDFDRKLRQLSTPIEWDQLRTYLTRDGSAPDWGPDGEVEDERTYVPTLLPDGSAGALRRVR